MLVGHNQLLSWTLRGNEYNLVMFFSFNSLHMYIVREKKIICCTIYIHILEFTH